MKKGLVLTLVLTLGLGAMVGCISNNRTVSADISKEEMEVINVLKSIEASIHEENKIKTMEAEENIVRLLHELSDIKELERINQENN